ncbi:hypothetical protein HK102_006819 [Quaeritorhiza haematococci]|nr:hypothetical protein HK102_006819 [Quaeritorhiza haematococci]
MAPREQIYGPIDQANRYAIIVVVVVTMLVLIVTTVIMFFIVRPLAAVAMAMQKLTTFDFTVLEGGNLLTVDSLVTEIVYIQETFTTMVRAFAAGLRTNKLLIAGARASASVSSVMKESSARASLLGTPTTESGATRGKHEAGRE